MTSFLPDRDRRTVEECMTGAGIVCNEEGGGDPSTYLDDRGHNHEWTLDEELVEKCRRIPIDPLLVPNPRFETNPNQARVMSDILEAHYVGEKALLISGYQGVGKNKIVDHLLHTLNAEREYLQLHRDTTVQQESCAESAD